eukprot:10884223-Alexandrium_andersonii.AAC.1
MAAGGFFVLENPASSAAWEAVAALRQLCRCPGAQEAVFDQCCLGLVDASGAPQRKPVSYTHLTLPTICSV